MHILPIHLTTSGINVDFGQLEKALALPDVARDPEDQDDRDGQHDTEPALGIVESTTDWGDGNEELGGEDDDAEEEAEPGAPDTEDGLMGDLVDGVAMGFPCGAEADMRLSHVSVCLPWACMSNLRHRWSPMSEEQPKRTWPGASQRQSSHPEPSERRQ